MNKKVILITGGSKGLGAEFVKALLSSEDNAVYFTYSDKSAEFQPSGNVTPILCDQKNEAEIIDCVAQIVNAQGRIDVLVNNACSGFKPCDFLDTDWNMFQDIIDVNVKGAYLFTREAARSMKQQGNGRIINIVSSYVVNVPPEKLSFYITAKYALAGLSKATAVELGKYGVTVNMISPGLMATQLTNYLPARYLEAYKQKHPMKRMTTTADVAEVLKFLISDGAQFLNGVNIPVNGGEAF
ncbi:3-oxoacyl-[acyl-carrier protein] reductase [Sporobacter termitidis DSM 10068]|uniref:3-oxoacyl-[acyl-carrier protein] reductase n=1 Tax=Sporobacter termitidis DSM 10068 TaxID=1123282 RepID=A0A1M5U8R2_9FIRM|nr:SDR family oxidoreductase [Sporobacter termitidis]SHH59339.1 3-oxoacyl-[acyl-carrier protein] reductase [Sporobacter termitidis DSM 10068]